jgi:RNA polymerase sigma factor (sigma-70 family)
VRDDPSVVALVTRAAGSDEDAWHEIVERYAPLVWSICARYRLRGTDVEDVSQTVWLGLVEQLGRLREPAALPGWLATTTQRECLRVLRMSSRYETFRLEADDSLLATEAKIEEEILRAERYAKLRAALAELGEGDRRLLTLLLSDPPLPYARISEILGIAQGSIGPMRGRCLARLRRSPHLRGLTDADFTPGRVSTAGG